jgi:hypothetical protein
MRPSTASPINPYACSQRILGVAPSPLALAEALQQHTLLATQTSVVVTTTCPENPVWACASSPDISRGGHGILPTRPRRERVCSAPRLRLLPDPQPSGYKLPGQSRPCRVQTADSRQSPAQNRAASHGKNTSPRASVLTNRRGQQGLRFPNTHPQLATEVSRSIFFLDRPGPGLTDRSLRTELY